MRARLSASTKSIIRPLVPKPLRAAWRGWMQRYMARKSPREIFSHIYRTGGWGGQADFYSGGGSYIPEVVTEYVNAIAKFTSNHPGARVVDLGCGDFHIGSRIAPLCHEYIGCDVVPELISRNRRLYPNTDFQCVDIISDRLPLGDIALLRQVLQHLSNDHISAVLKQLVAAKYKFIVVTEHLPRGDFLPNIDKPTGAGFRLHGRKPSGIVLTSPPFSFPIVSSTVLCELSDVEGIIRTIAFGM